MINEQFNHIYNLSDIINVYKGRDKSISLCLLWDKEELPDLIITESRDIVTQENEEGVERDGITELSIH